VSFPELSAEEMRRHIAKLALINAKTAPLLLGPPGVGKSVATQEAMHLISKAVLIAALKSYSEKHGAGKVSQDLVHEAFTEEAVKAKYAEVTADVLVELERVPEVLKDESHLLLERKLKDKETADKVTSAVLGMLLDEYKRAMLDKEAVASVLRYAKAVFKDTAAELVLESAVRAAVERAVFGVEPVGLAMRFDTSVPVPLYTNSLLYVSFNVSSMTESDVTGLPYIGPSGAETIQSKWASAARKAAFAIINLDEVTNKLPTVIKSALYNIVLNRQVGAYEFGKFVVATGNTKDSSSLVDSLPGPLFTGRFSQYYVKPPTVEDWIRFMRRKYGKKWAYEVVAPFLLITSKHSKLTEGAEGLRDLIEQIAAPYSDTFALSKEEYFTVSKIIPGKTPAFPSPRAWTAVSTALYKLGFKGVREARKGVSEEDKEVARSYVLATLGMPAVANMLIDLLDVVTSIYKSASSSSLAELEEHVARLVNGIGNLLAEAMSGGGDARSLLNDLLRSTAELLILVNAVDPRDKEKLKAVAKSEAARTEGAGVLVSLIDAFVR